MSSYVLIWTTESNVMIMKTGSKGQLEQWLAAFGKRVKGLDDRLAFWARSQPTGSDRLLDVELSIVCRRSRLPIFPKNLHNFRSLVWLEMEARCIFKALTCLMITRILVHHVASSDLTWATKITKYHKILSMIKHEIR